MKRLIVWAGIMVWLGAAAPAWAQTGSGWLGGSPLHQRVRVGSAGDTYVGVWVEAPQMVAVPRTRAPMAVSLVIDTSGSMAGQKIANARMAAASLVESLRDGDVVSVYAFSNQVLQIAPPTVIGPGTRGQLIGGIQGLYAGGGTNLHGGVQVGLQQMQHAPASHTLRRVFLISDGRATIGPSDPSSLGDLVARGTEWGAQVTAIGVGHDYDQTTLHAMAVRSAGRLYHLSQPQQMAAILEGELNLLSRSVAVNAYLEVTPERGVTILSGETSGAVLQGGRLRFPLGQIYAGQRREVLFRARVNTHLSGSHRLARARLVYAEPSSSAQQQQELAIAYRVARDQAAPAPRVAAMVANHQATRAQMRAAQAMRAGDQQRAVSELARARQTLATAAAAAPGAPASAALRRRAARMERSQRSAEGAATPTAQAASAYEFEDEAAEAEGY